jgi:hypothetical protein
VIDISWSYTIPPRYRETGNFHGTCGKTRSELAYMTCNSLKMSLYLAYDLSQVCWATFLCRLIESDMHMVWEGGKIGMVPSIIPALTGFSLRSLLVKTIFPAVDSATDPTGALDYTCRYTRRASVPSTPFRRALGIPAARWRASLQPITPPEDHAHERRDHQGEPDDPPECPPRLLPRQRHVHAVHTRDHRWDTRMMVATAKIFITALT